MTPELPLSILAFNNSYELFKNRKELNIIKQNKKYYKHEENVELLVDIKNIPNYVVNVFEIDLENYYKKNLKEFDD